MKKQKVEGGKLFMEEVVKRVMKKVGILEELEKHNQKRLNGWESSFLTEWFEQCQSCYDIFHENDMKECPECLEARCKDCSCLCN